MNVTTRNLKLVSAIFYQIFIFSPNDGTKNYEKMFFISLKKLFFKNYEKCFLFHLKSFFFPSFPNSKFHDSKGQMEVE